MTVVGRERAMMNHAGFTMAKRQQLWCEAAQTATMLDNILVQDSAKSPSSTQFFGVDAKYSNHLRAFGEMCVVADTDNKVGRTKIDPRGKISLLVGYSPQHAGDVYRDIGVDNIVGRTKIDPRGKISLFVGYSTDRIPSTTPGAEPPRDARDSGSARSHSTHLETSSSERP